MCLDNALKILFLQIGQGNKIAIQKGQAIVVITHIETLTHPRNHLIHKAEDTVIVASANLVKNCRFKLQAQILIGIFIYMYLTALTFSIFQL